MRTVRSKMLKAARSLATRDWERPKVIQLARHMAHEGLPIKKIIEALGWELSESAARHRLHKYNIHPHKAKRRDPRRGDTPYLSPSQCRTGEIDQRSYEPKHMGAAQ